MTNGTQPRILAIGGGTGGPTVIEAVRTYNIVPVSICTMFDSGGSSGELRDAHGVLPPGDIRRAILAHHPSGDDTLRRLFTYRYADGGASRLAGHSLGNLMAAAAEEMWGREDSVLRLARLFNVEGDVWPVSIDSADLVAVLEDGERIVGETNIDRRAPTDLRAIKHVELNPPAFAYKSAIEAIHSAAMIVLGPGDFYTSTIPNLLVKGITEALHTTRARIVYVVNVMTKHGETDGYNAADFVEKLCGYELGPGLIDTVVVNTSAVPDPLCELYRSHEHQAVPVAFNPDIRQRILRFAKEVIATDLLHVDSFAENLIRHDPRKLGRTLMSILEGTQARDARLWVVDLDDTLVHTTRDLNGDGSRFRELKLADGAREFLERYHGNVVLVTKGDASLQNSKLDHLDIRDHFRDIVIVDDELGKTLAIARIVRDSGLPSAQITVIGDRVDSEIKAGKALGCVTIRMCLPEGKYSGAPKDPHEEPDHCIKSFDELARLG